MSTQKTKTGQGSGQGGKPVRPQSRHPQDERVERVPPPPSAEVEDDFPPEEYEGEDLGIPEGVDDDPTGYVPPTAPQVLAGRKVRPVRPQDLEEAHRRYAGNVNIVGDREPNSGDGMRTAEDRPDPNTARMAEAYTPGAAAEARRLMPQQFVQQPQQSASQQPRQAQQPQRSQQPQEAQATEEDTPQDIARAAAAFEYLTKVNHDARVSGSTERASQTNAMLGALKEDYDVEEAKTAQGRHPILQRLVGHFGLEKIKATEVEWCGFKWRFAPTNTKLDLWIGENLNGAGYNAAALLLAASVVGIDGEPVYRVLRVPLTKTYLIKDKKTGAQKEITTNLYDKTCTCGASIDVDASQCSACGGVQDIFLMPNNLRMECAERMNKFFEENFGAYEELAQLVQLRDAQMKHRLMNKEELYPFLPKKPSS